MWSGRWAALSGNARRHGHAEMGHPVQHQAADLGFGCCPAMWMTASWTPAKPAVRYGRSEEGRGAMALSLDAAAEVFREAMRDTVKRYALWYLIQGVLLIATGMLAIIYPVLSSTAVVVLLG